MKIKINENFEINCDGIEFTLIEKYMGKDKNGQEKEQISSDRHYPSLESCCKMLIDKMIANNSTSEDQLKVQELIDIIQRSQKQILNAIRESGLTIKEIYGKKI